MKQKGRAMPASEETSGRRRAANSAPTGRSSIDKTTSKTLAEQIYDWLHQEITQLSLPPGTPVLEREIAAQFGASRTPVREAVLRLVKENLVEVVPKSGTFVARIPLSVLPEAIVARRALERDMVRRAAAKASPSQILRLRAIVEENKEAASGGSQEIFDRTDSAFHAEIAAIAGYPGIWDIIQQIKTPTDRHRHLTFPESDRMHQVVREHAAIAEAIRSGDTALAEERMDHHLRQLKHDTLRTYEQYPDYFIKDMDLENLAGD